jgi:glycosyltransferase involved in cell wall biosynthesis
MGDPAALAQAIRTLADDGDLRQRIAAGGHRVFRQRLTTQAIAGQLAPIIENQIRVPLGSSNFFA